MRRKTPLVLTICIFTVCSSLLLQGQNSSAPDSNNFGFGVFSLSIRTLPNAPFTATVRTEVVRRLEDGNTMVRKSHRLVARDSSGRVFEERRFLTANDDQHPSALQFTDLRNPLSHQLYICEGSGQVCHLYLFIPPPSISASFMPSTTNQETTINIGTSMISGVEVTGTRVLTVIPARVVGSSRPITLSKEIWYSPQLGVNIKVKRYDPRIGTESFLIDDLIVGEPDPSVFEHPTGATIVQEAASPPDVQ